MGEMVPGCGGSVFLVPDTGLGYAIESRSYRVAMIPRMLLESDSSLLIAALDVPGFSTM